MSEIPIIGAGKPKHPLESVKDFVEACEKKVMGIWMREDQIRLARIIQMLLVRGQKQSQNMADLLLVTMQRAIQCGGKLSVELEKAREETKDVFYDCYVTDDGKTLIMEVKTAEEVKRLAEAAKEHPDGNPTTPQA